jgi:hypothetical protein
MSAPVQGGIAVEAARVAAGGREKEESVRAVAGGRRVRGPEESPYSWLQGYLARLDGKEARAEYYAWLG